MSYSAFLARKHFDDAPSGLAVVPPINPMLFDFQRAIVSWALRRGRCAIFADCGMGKTPMQLEWAHHVPGRKIIVAPLAVSVQTEREGAKFGVPAKYLRADDGQAEIVVTNYEMLDNFNPADFNGIVLDESSILKSYTGKIRTHIIEHWGTVPFRLAATATPAPNDYMELGNHSEFLGVMSRTEMLSMFFVHDGSETQQWRLKGHAEDEFWRWMCSWAVMIRKPSDLGFEDNGFILPKCHINDIMVRDTAWSQDLLFPMVASTLAERLDARRRTVSARVEECARLANASNEPRLIWCNLNSESSAIVDAVHDAVEVKGSDDMETKSERLLGFASGKYRVLVTKPSIAGFGMNWQHCADMDFVGLSDSYEQFYQALRRCWRFGQTKEVHANIITADTEGAVTANIRRKERESMAMADNMVRHMKDISTGEIRGTRRMSSEYKPKQKMKAPSFL
jgi:hypothetical protein